MAHPASYVNNTFLTTDSLQISYAQHLASKGAADAEHDDPGAAANVAKDSELPWGFGGNRHNMTMISGNFRTLLTLLLYP